MAFVVLLGWGKLPDSRKPSKEWQQRTSARGCLVHPEGPWHELTGNTAEAALTAGSADSARLSGMEQGRPCPVPRAPCPVPLLPPEGLVYASLSARHP